MKLFARSLLASTIVFASPVAIVESSLAQAFNPPNEGEPVQTVGGASRGTCSSGPIQDIKFFQKQNDLSQPILEAQLPPDMAQQVFFSLRDANNETVYQGFLPVNADTNTVKVDYLSLGNMETANSHRWSMAIICGKALRPDSPVFQGTL
ncbi:MAG: DUF928 domain-containing protein [Prochlorotrichaceae cyanobacterium]|jgi:hypothetical protein